jgi:hypothetical protein
VQLIVSDGTLNSAPATFTVSTKNSPPVANAVAEQTVTTQTSVQLDGSRSSDIDGDALTYTWTLTAPPSSHAVLSNASRVNPTFVSDQKGTYTAQLIGNDGLFNSQPSTVAIGDQNSPPVANAGPNQSITLGQTAPF